MVWTNLKFKKTFYSTITVIEAKEKRRISSAVTYGDKRNSNLKKMRMAIKELRIKGIKPTQKNVASMVLSLPTVKRLWKEIKTKKVS